MGLKEAYSKYVVCGILIVIMSSSVFAQTKSLDTIFSEIDAIIANYVSVPDKRAAAITAALDSYAGNPNFVSIETYVIKKARYYIIYANYSYARDIAYAVVNRNLDNIDAAMLYDAANKAISRQEEEQRIEDETKREKDIAYQIKSEKIKEGLKTGYETVKSSSGEIIYFDQSVNEYYSPYIWNFAMRFADFSMVLDDDEMSLQYGAGAQGSFFYYGESFAAGGEFMAEMSIIPLSGLAGMFSTVKLAGCLGLPIKKSILCAQLGFFMHNNDMKSDNDPFLSPLVGICWREIHIGSSTFSMYFDYFPLHFMQDDLNFAGEIGANIGFPLFKSDAVVMNFSVGFQDTMMIYSDGSRNKAEFIFALGVGNND